VASSNSPAGRLDNTAQTRQQTRFARSACSCHGEEFSQRAAASSSVQTAIFRRVLSQRTSFDGNSTRRFNRIFQWDVCHKN
jgi:hypothetical protein